MSGGFLFRLGGFFAALIAVAALGEGVARRARAAGAEEEAREILNSRVSDNDLEAQSQTGPRAE